MKNAFTVKGLTKTYHSFTLGPMDLTLPAGYIMGFVGENGAGKSTAIKALLGLITPDGGEITLLERDPRDRAVMEDVGSVLDSGCFPSEMNAREIGTTLKLLYKNWDSEFYRSLLRRFELDEKKTVKSYSRGMVMKLSLATALSHRPKLLLLDEPTGGLDPVVRSEILDLLQEFIQEEDHSVFLSSHITTDLEKIADYIVFLHQGRIVLQGEKDLLLDKYGVLKCGREDLLTLEPEAVVGYRENQFGVEALVERYKAPPCFPVDDATLDDIMFFSVKGEKPRKEDK